MDVFDGIVIGISCSSLFWIIFSLPRIKPVVSYQMWLDKEQNILAELAKANFLGDKNASKLWEADLIAHQIRKPKMPWPERLWNRE